MKCDKCGVEVRYDEGYFINGDCFLCEECFYEEEDEYKFRWDNEEDNEED